MTSMTTGKFSQDIEHFLAFKRALGYSYKRNEYMLQNFLRFAEHQCAHEKNLVCKKFNVESTLQAWLSRSPDRNPNTISIELNTFRQLCLFKSRRDPKTFVPDSELAPPSKSTRIPYIFTDKEIKRILEAARNHRGRSIWPSLLYTLVLILYCTGLRLGEVVRLQLSDIDRHQRVLLIRESKGRTRFVPYGKDLSDKIEDYLNERMSILQRVKSVNEKAVFVGKNGKPLITGIVSGVIIKLFRKLGLKPKKGRIGPRPYDFRHSYAVTRLSDWYRTGVDIHARLPWLSAYMGHKNLLGTEIYLHATEELLQLASNRFEEQFKARRKK